MRKHGVTGEFDHQFSEQLPGMIVTKLSPSLDSVAFTTLLGAEINSIAVPKSTSFVAIITSFFTTSIYTTGYRYRPGSNVSDPTNADAFVVKENDSPLLTLFQPIDKRSQ